MKTNLNKSVRAGSACPAIAHILTILLIGGIGVQTMISCSGDDGGGGGGTSLPSSSSGGSIDEDCLLELPPVAPCIDEEIAIGDQIWSKCNLNVVPSTGNPSMCYCNKPENCEKYGRLYDRIAAMTACPSGWHLPSYEEWDALLNYAIGYADTSLVPFAGAKLMATSGWEQYPSSIFGAITDEYGFSALPGGSCFSDGTKSSCSSAGEMGSWWTANRGAKGMFAGMVISQSLSTYDSGGGYWALSVRCVKD